MEDDYIAYKTGDPFLEEFVDFSQSSRKKFSVTEEKEFWPLPKIYSLLKNQLGGFILDVGQHACLGINVKDVSDGWFEVTYRDPFNPKLKLLKINSRTLKTKDGNQVKIQWFGQFKFLKTNLGYQPGFSSLAKIKYKLNLPVNHKMLIQKNSFLCGDISAFLASKSNIIYSIKSLKENTK
ncbi:MAG: hypothetical protein ACXAC7_03010 [Candidatus Hodarchaeales archaeon]